MIDSVHPSERSAWLLAALTIVAVALYAIEMRSAAFHALPFMQPDSVTYLDANVARSPGYPLVLRIVARLPGGLARLGTVQHVAMLAAGVFMAACFGALYKRAVLAVALLVATLANPPLVSYSYTVLPEALLIAALMVHLGCVMMLARGWRAPVAAAAGASAAIVALLKPTGYAAILALPVVAWHHRRHWRSLGWLAAPAVAVLFAASAVNYATRGVFATQSQGGYSRAAYTAVLLDPKPEGPYPELTQRIGTQTSPIRDALFSIRDPQLEALVGATEYHVVEAVVHREVIGEIERELGMAVTDTNLFPRDPAVALLINKIGSTIAAVAIRQHPREYVRMVAVNVWALWWQPLVQSPSSSERLQARLEAVLAAHPILDRSPMAFRVLPLPAFLIVRAVLAAVIGGSLVGLAFAASTSAGRHVLGHASVLLHGYFVGVSAAQPGLPRYAVAVWPASMLVLFSAAALWARIARARAS